MTTISLVIATRNRAQSLNRCLSYVAEMRTTASWELVLVDNGSTDGTPELIRAFQRSASFPVTVVAEPVPGLGRAHNRGWHVSAGEIIAFTDDDCYVLPNYIEEALKVFTDPKIGYCGGRVELHDKEDYPITIIESLVPQVFRPCSYLQAGELIGANMIFRRRTLEAIGGFDASLGPGTPFNFEDIDAFSRAAFLGWWGAYAPGPTVRHAHGRRAPDIPALKRSYAIGRGAYAAKCMLQRESRRCHFRSWALPLPNRLLRPGRRECLYEIEGAIRYIVKQRLAASFIDGTRRL